MDFCVQNQIRFFSLTLFRTPTASPATSPAPRRAQESREERPGPTSPHSPASKRIASNDRFGDKNARGGRPSGNKGSSSNIRGTPPPGPSRVDSRNDGGPPRGTSSPAVSRVDQRSDGWAQRGGGVSGGRGLRGGKDSPSPKKADGGGFRGGDGFNGPKKQMGRGATIEKRGSDPSFGSRGGSGPPRGGGATQSRGGIGRGAEMLKAQGKEGNTQNTFSILHAGLDSNPNPNPNPILI